MRVAHELFLSFPRTYPAASQAPPRAPRRALDSPPIRIYAHTYVRSLDDGRNPGGDPFARGCRLPGTD